MRPPARGVSSTARLGARARAAHEPRSTRSRCTARRAGSERAPARGKLKVFFGAAPGVGKTYAMLEARAGRARRGRRRRRRGGRDARPRRDAVRWSTGCSAGGAAAPARRVPGHALQEFDLDAALRARPARCCWSTSWRTPTPPGSGTPSAGRTWSSCSTPASTSGPRSTSSTSRASTTSSPQITGVRVRETVPDAVLERADEIELVDLPPDELLERLREGKVYVADQAERAAASFFRQGNLLALRELALRRTAERVDARRAAPTGASTASRRPGRSAERVLVCVGPSPGSADLVRAARAHGHGLARADWMAATSRRRGARRCRQEARARVDRAPAARRGARRRGGDAAPVSGAADAHPASYAREHNVTRIVVGKPTHPRWRDFGCAARCSTSWCAAAATSTSYVIARRSRPTGPGAARRRGATAAGRRGTYLAAAASWRLATAVCLGAVRPRRPRPTSS